MKKMVAVILILLFGSVGLAYGQASKDVYKAVKKAELKATGRQVDFENSMSDARAEFDLFKDSKEAKKNPEFTTHINNAIEGLKDVQFYGDKDFHNADKWKNGMNKAKRELEAAKQYLK